MLPNVSCGFWSHLLKKSLMENFIFCAVSVMVSFQKSKNYLQLLKLLKSEAVARMCSVKKCIYKFFKIRRKTPVLESFFDKVTG